jgi:MoxR-like ATPase
MGKNPRNASLKPEKPGFMVIGTQNPITMAGRRAPSTALLRRLITSTLPEYSDNEMRSILKNKGIAPEEVELMINIYQSKREQAIKEHLNPIPNARNLINLADNHLKGLASLKTKSPRSTSNPSNPHSFFEPVRPTKDLNEANPSPRQNHLKLRR